MFKNYSRNLFLLSIIISYQIGYAVSLDLTGISSQLAVRQLEPVTEIIAAEHTPPLSFLSYHNNPYLAVNGSIYTVALPEFNVGYPGIWFAMSITPNLCIGVNMTGSKWLDDNIQTIGPFVSTIWGTPDKSVNAGFHFHNLKGPDDFHLTDVAFDLARNIDHSKWKLGYGVTAHYFKTYIHVTDNLDSTQNYKMTRNLQSIFARVGMYRFIGKNLEIGSEFFLTTGNLIGILNLTYNL